MSQSKAAYKASFTAARRLAHTKQPAKIKRFLTYHDLPAKGIDYHPNHLRLMWSRGKFPKPFKLTPHRLAWPEEVIDQWLDSRVEVA